MMEQITIRTILMMSGLMLGLALLYFFYMTFLWAEQQPEGISYQGEKLPAQARLLKDLSWVDAAGVRQSEQQIFSEIFIAIEKARRFILVDMFLFNDFQGSAPETTRLLAGELTEKLVTQKNRYPEMDVVLITDPVNTVYGGLVSSHIARLKAAGVTVVVTNLDALKDSNRVYSIFWRMFVRPWGDGKGELLPNPFGEGRVSLRSYLRLLNFKANHRKLAVCDDGDQLTGFVISANPHDGSSAHSNIGLQFYGAPIYDLLTSEQEVLKLSGSSIVLPAGNSRPAQIKRLQVDPSVFSSVELQVLTEQKIRKALLATINQAQVGDQLDVMMFYLSHRKVIGALIKAHHRGVKLRVILDPNKDAFGRQKSGIPNRPVAAELHQQGVPVRWCHTHGEQCHSKLILARYQSEQSRLLLGSANFTRRNLDDFNLETDVLVEASIDSPLMVVTSELIDEIWQNSSPRFMSVPYPVFADESVLKRVLYLLMEKTGVSTF